MYSEYKKCRCGYSILVYIQDGKITFIDGMSGNYEQTVECPGCHDYIEYIMLEDDAFN